ncbi:hypothetical protein GW765_03525 [Candidatus Parcubacteria bacterium]|nr:hypothetical protein [Candidatus Parcubacteria bacterium]
MSNWAEKRKKRILLLTGLVFVVVAGTILFFVFNKKPTCFDQKMNGTEVGIDCGGVCQRVCRDEIRDIVVWWERPFRVSNGVYSTVAYFENQNLDAGLQELTYEFRLYNYDNVLISEPILGTTFIEPNKRSAVFESGITTGSEEAYTAFFKVSSVQDWKKTDPNFAYSLFEIGEPSLTNQDISPRLSVEITNTSLQNFIDIPVIVVLYNQKDNAIGASQTYVERINQGESALAYFSWPEPFGDTVSRIEVLPRVNPFNQN